jgi:hypothetical protein
VKSNEAGSCVLTLTVPAKIAKKLKLKGPVGTLKLTLTAGRVKGFKLKLSKAAATKLAKLRSISFVLSARCKDAAGNAGKASKAFRLK